MFASDKQLDNYKPTKACDVASVMYVVYFFVENGLPWTDYVDLIMARDKSQNLYSPKNFKQIRLMYQKDFQSEYENWVSPFGDIFRYVYSILNAQSQKNPLDIDYSKIIKMLPSSLSLNKN